MTCRFVSYLVVATLLMTGASCSSSNSPGAGGADAFVGTWTYAGAITPTCSGQALSPVDLTGDQATITAPDASHIEMMLGSSCTATFTVSGATATAQPNQMCTFTVMGMQAEVTVSSWTLTLAGGSLTSKVSGTALSICTVSGTGTLTKVAGGDSDAATGG